MSDDKIAEIRAQHKASDNNFIEYESTWDIHAHRAFLLAEVDRRGAENERLTRHVRLLQDKIDAERSCACAYDDPNEVCLPHSPLLANALAEVERLRAMLPPTAHSGVRNGPGEGSWSVYAAKVVEERDAARAEVERLRAWLEMIARLGNEPLYGNSVWNQMARNALEGKP